MNILLSDEHPLQVLPELATRIGLNEAIILQQIHYWNVKNKERNNNFKDGYNWSFNSYAGWKEQFPFMSKRTIQRSFIKLENMGLLITGNYNKLGIDRTKWYRINYSLFEQLYKSPTCQNGTINMPKWHHHCANLSSPLPESTSEIIAENSRITSNFQFDGYEQYFIEEFERFFGYPHRKINTQVTIDTEATDGELIYYVDDFFHNYSTGDRGVDMEKCSIEVFAEHIKRYEKHGMEE